MTIQSSKNAEASERLDKAIHVWEELPFSVASDDYEDFYSLGSRNLLMFGVCCLWCGFLSVMRNPWVWWDAGPVVFLFRGRLLACVNYYYGVVYLTRNSPQHYFTLDLRTSIPNNAPSFNPTSHPIQVPLYVHSKAKNHQRELIPAPRAFGPCYSSFDFFLHAKGGTPSAEAIIFRPKWQDEVSFWRPMLWDSALRWRSRLRGREDAYWVCMGLV